MAESTSRKRGHTAKGGAVRRSTSQQQIGMVSNGQLSPKGPPSKADKHADKNIMSNHRPSFTSPQSIGKQNILGQSRVSRSPSSPIIGDHPTHPPTIERQNVSFYPTTLVSSQHQ